MPDWGGITNQRQAPAAPAGGGIWGGARRAPVASEPEEEFIEPEPTPGVGVAYAPPEDEGLTAGQQFGVGGALAGGSLLLAGLARRNPSVVKEAVRKLGQTVNTARYTSMLSGLAPIKSALGNIGAPIVESAQRGTAEPMRQFATRETLTDWLAALKNPELSARMQGITDMPGAFSKWNLPGRIMGAGDYATQRALTRAGLTEAEAQQATLMTPLTRQRFGELGPALSSPAAELLIPFRRVPFNQFLEGLKALKTTAQDPLGRTAQITAGAAGSGALAGAVSAEQEYPAFPAFVAAMAGRYGLPVALAAAVARFAMGRGGGGIPGSVLPVSEYGFEETLKNPLRPLDPSYWGIVRAHRRLVEGR